MADERRDDELDIVSDDDGTDEDRSSEFEPQTEGRSGGRRSTQRRPRRRPRQFRRRRKVCGFCVDKVTHIDYKDVSLLRRYITERGKIQPRRKTGTCAKHQRPLARAIKRARYVALLPHTADHLRLHGG